ncbi:MAG: hypothetical protein K6A69_02150, partial [Lachnospiraceae bacterium]|nr:hypothetical protein [Lachnospiraceae bacterium]
NTLTYGSNATFTKTENEITFTTGGENYSCTQTQLDNSGNLQVEVANPSPDTGSGTINFIISPNGTVTQ